MRKTLFIPMLACALVLAAFELAYSGKIYPGVTVAGVSLGNHTINQAASRLAVTLPAQPIQLTWSTSE